MLLKKQLYCSKAFVTRGVTLLEVMLATALILLGLVLGIGMYKKVVLHRNVAQIQNSVIFLENALQQYYNVNCYWFLGDPNSYSTVYAISLNENLPIVPKSVSSSDPNPTLIDYIPNLGMINNPYAAKLGVGSYTYQIDTRADFPILSVSTQFSSTVSTALLSILQGLLKPTNVANKTFTWSITLNQPVKNQFNALNASVSYVNAMAGKLYLDTRGRQYGDQYEVGYYGTLNQFSNVCAFWQQPPNRCGLIALNGSFYSARCTYQ